MILVLEWDGGVRNGGVIRRRWEIGSEFVFLKMKSDFVILEDRFTISTVLILN